MTSVGVASASGRRGRASIVTALPTTIRGVSPLLAATLEGEPPSATPVVDPTDLLGSLASLGCEPPPRIAAAVAAEAAMATLSPEEAAAVSRLVAVGSAPSPAPSPSSSSAAAAAAAAAASSAAAAADGGGGGRQSFIGRGSVTGASPSARGSVSTIGGPGGEVSAAQLARRQRVAMAVRRAESLNSAHAASLARLRPSQRLTAELTEVWPEGRHASLARLLAASLDPGRIPQARALLRRWARHGGQTLRRHCVACYRLFLRQGSPLWSRWGVSALAELAEPPAAAVDPVRAQMAVSVLAEAALRAARLGL